MTDATAAATATTTRLDDPLIRLEGLKKAFPIKAGVLQRTVAEVRHAFTKFGGNLGADGSVAYLFNHVGQLFFPSGSDEDTVMEAAIEAGAEDVIVDEDGSIEVLTEPAEFEQVRDAMASTGLEPEGAELTMRASTNAELGVDEASSMVKMLEMLEDLDDVQQVYSNADISDEILASL